MLSAIDKNFSSVNDCEKAWNSIVDSRRKLCIIELWPCGSNKSSYCPFTPKCQYLFSPNSFLYISLVQRRRIHQTKLLRLVIISFILMILTNDSSGLLWGELGCLSPLVYKGFKMQNKDLSLIIDYFLSCKLIS